tara:strand:+ start:826 stop:3141 length:2316 start_codon:yes stop_codon:yes gene_type:complete
MEFKEYRDSEQSPTKGELLIWKWLKSQFDSEPDNGSCYEQFPFYSANHNRYRPDILLIHPKYGVNVISIKDLRIENLKLISGDWWHFNDWYEDKSDPLMNSERAMWAVHNQISSKLKRKNSSLNLKKIAFNNLLALPFISETDFQIKFPDDAKDKRKYLMFKETFEEDGNIDSIFNQFTNKMNAITTIQFKEIRQTIDAAGDIIPANIIRRSDTCSKGHLLDLLNAEITNLDSDQHNSAMTIPAGPQRIRGLAGTGKTVVIAMKAALIYREKPEWEILVTFGTKALYYTLYNLIDYFINKVFFADESIINQEKINWKDRIKLLPSWGSQKNNEPGVYSTACEKYGHKFQSVSDIRNSYGSTIVPLELACRDLLTEKQEDIVEIFDAILVDEGQDLPNSFYTLCMNLLKAPKRMIIGWDDMQSLGKLDIRDAETLLGEKSEGVPYSFLGEYPGGIVKDVILQNCYRSPRQVIFLAHMFGLGIKRSSGCLQFIDDPQAWKDIGYNIEPQTDDKLETNSTITLSRGYRTSKNTLESYPGIVVNEIITKSAHATREEEAKYISSKINLLIEKENLKPEEIAVVSINGTNKIIDEYEKIISDNLPDTIKILNGRRNPNQNKKDNHIYLGSAYRAKGNQYGFVFVVAIEGTYSSNEYSTKDVRARNVAFSAMTRTKAWLHISGIGEEASLIIDEINQICSDLNSCSIKFQVPNINRLRALDTEEHRKIRKANIEARVKKGSIIELLNKDPAVLNQILDFMDPDKAELARNIINKDEL